MRIEDINKLSDPLLSDHHDFLFTMVQDLDTKMLEIKEKVRFYTGNGVATAPLDFESVDQRLAGYVAMFPPSEGLSAAEVSASKEAAESQLRGVAAVYASIKREFDYVGSRLTSNSKKSFNKEKKVK